MKYTILNAALCVKAVGPVTAQSTYSVFSPFFRLLDLPRNNRSVVEEGKLGDPNQESEHTNCVREGDLQREDNEWC